MDVILGVSLEMELRSRDVVWVGGGGEKEGGRGREGKYTDIKISNGDREIRNKDTSYCIYVFSSRWVMINQMIFVNIWVNAILSTLNLNIIIILKFKKYLARIHLLTNMTTKKKKNELLCIWHTKAFVQVYVTYLYSKY